MAAWARAIGREECLGCGSVWTELRYGALVACAVLFRCCWAVGKVFLAGGHQRRRRCATEFHLQSKLARAHHQRRR
jgi:hypothetical protein